MEIWIIAGICAFLIFISGIVVLFFPAKRKIGAILTSAGMLLLVGSIIGIIVSFHITNKFKMMYSIILLKVQAATAEETKTYQINYEDSADNIKKKSPLSRSKRKKPIQQ